MFISYQQDIILVMTEAHLLHSSIKVGDVEKVKELITTDIDMICNESCEAKGFIASKNIEKSLLKWL